MLPADILGSKAHVNRRSTALPRRATISSRSSATVRSQVVPRMRALSAASDGSGPSGAGPSRCQASYQRNSPTSTTGQLLRLDQQPLRLVRLTLSLGVVGELPTQHAR